MEAQKKKVEEETIDLLHIARMLLKRLWLIVIAGLLGASIGLVTAGFLIAPNYSSSILLYVNNSSLNLGSTSISFADLQVSQGLVNTYGVILNARTTLERVAEKADVSYTASQLSGMIAADAVGKTEVMKVTVTSEDPYEAATIANAVAEVLPERISEIISGASAEVVDSAVPNVQKISPSISRYTMIGLAVGVLLSAAVIVLLAIFDDTIHDEEYILQTYDYPILTKIPNLRETESKHYGGYAYANSYAHARSEQVRSDKSSGTKD